MIIKILGIKGSAAYDEAERIIKKLGHAVWDETYYYIDLAVAPLLTEKLTAEQMNEPQIGTLIFHPSPLPYGRGASAIKWAYRRSDPITAATWFWANDKMDAGDICEQEVVAIDYLVSPKEFYLNDIIPALGRTLERCLNAVQKGFIRRVPQVEKYATFDFKIQKK